MQIYVNLVNAQVPKAKLGYIIRNILQSGKIFINLKLQNFLIRISWNEN